MGATRYVAGSLAFLAIGVAGVVADPNKADAAPSRCTVGVTIFEDGSWSGTSVTLDGVKVAHRWEVGHYLAPDRTYIDRNRQRVRVMGGFAPDFAGQPCSVVLGR